MAVGKTSGSISTPPRRRSSIPTVVRSFIPMPWCLFLKRRSRKERPQHPSTSRRTLCFPLWKLLVWKIFRRMPSGRAWVRPLPRPGLTTPLPAPGLFFPCRCAIMGPNFRASGPEAHLVRNGAYNYDFSGIDAASVFAAQVQQ